MSLLFRKPEARSASFQQTFGSGGDSPIRGDSLAAALSLIPVYAATGLIADQIAAAPWAVFSKPAGVPVRLASQPPLVSDPGVNDLDLFSWKHQLITSLLLRGNAYGFIVDTDSGGVPSKVLWLRPDLMEIDESAGRAQFFYEGKAIARADIMHIPLYVVPGSIKGLSPISLFRSQIETGLEAQRVGRNFFKRGMVPSALLKNTAKTLSAEQSATVKARFVASVSSSEPFVTGSDWDYTAIGLPSSDVAFLTGIKATATQIAAVYRVSPELIGGETSSSLTYKNLEQDQIRFNTTTLLPIASRVEAVANRHLPDGHYVKFNLDASVRADLKTRYEAHQIAITGGFLTDDEVRALEERPPLTAVQRQQIADSKATATATTGVPSV